MHSAIGFGSFRSTTFPFLDSPRIYGLPILIASKRITDIDSDIQLLWEDSEEVQDALASGEISLTDEQMATRRKLYDEVSVDLQARLYAIKREAKGESRDQEAAVEDRSFEAAGVDDYLASGVDGISVSEHLRIL